MLIKWILRYGLVFFAFLLVDMVWLVFVARKFYTKHLGYIMRDPVNWPAAIVFYLLFVVGILFFVMSPALEKDSLAYAAIAGAMFGFMTYATYDLTNLATLKDWPIVVTVVDLIWGTFLSCATSVLGFIAIRKLVP